MRLKAFIVLIAILSLPTFLRMIRPGIHTTQDFHFFRLVEFDKCVRDLQIPCRWAPDAGYGYGEPLFNFYGQAPYFFGETFHLVGFSKLDSLKILFSLSLVGSAVTMFVFARRIWDSNSAGFLSSVLYLYAPYRAVDVWVRGALPEALAFVFFPLILYFLDKYIDREKERDALIFGFLLALLVITHNLSALMFLPVIFFWGVYKIIKLRKKRVVLNLFLVGLLSLLLTSFYLLPVIFESPFVTLEATTSGYFDFRGHFVGLAQLLTSRYWGYGASVFGNEDGLNLSVGHIQWIIPLLVVGLILLKKNLKKLLPAILLIVLGWAALFLAHSRSVFIWELFGFMKYIQFPWRFLGIALFCFSLASGLIIRLAGKIGKFVGVLVVLAAVLLNAGFFKEDIWLNVADEDLTKGQAFINQSASSIGDYWPRFGGELPEEFAPDAFEGTMLIEKGSNYAVYEILDNGNEVSFPISYFPGWVAHNEGESIEVYPNSRGLITMTRDENMGRALLKFENTRVRSLGNFLSLAGLSIFLMFYYREYFLKKVA